MDWIALYATVCADTGWTWDQVGRLTLPRLRALYARFKVQPPAHWLVNVIAQGFGWRPAAAPEAQASEGIDVRDAFDMFPGGALTMAHLQMLL